jgi:hypothetical protein
MRVVVTSRDGAPGVVRDRGIGFEQQSHPWHGVRSRSLGHENVMPRPDSGFDLVQIRARRRRSALLMTETELPDIAAAAIIGDSSSPKPG